jgi:hypothetical protein
MRAKGWLGFLGLAAASFAGFMGWGGGGAELPGSAALPLSASSIGIGALDWPSLGIGVLIGLTIAGAVQVSWLDLPRRFVRWLLVNERNFYRLGMAGVCLGVLLFY